MAHMARRTIEIDALRGKCARREALCRAHWQKTRLLTMLDGKSDAASRGVLRCEPVVIVGFDPILRNAAPVPAFTRRASQGGLCVFQKSRSAERP